MHLNLSVLRTKYCWSLFPDAVYITYRHCSIIVNICECFTSVSLVRVSAAVNCCWFQSATLKIVYNDPEPRVPDPHIGGAPAPFPAPYTLNGRLEPSSLNRLLCLPLCKIVSRCLPPHVYQSWPMQQTESNLTRVHVHSVCKKSCCVLCLPVWGIVLRCTDASNTRALADNCGNVNVSLPMPTRTTVDKLLDQVLIRRLLYCQVLPYEWDIKNCNRVDMYSTYV